MGGTPARRRAGTGAVALALALLLALILSHSPAHALAPPSPWNGVNPFRCAVQDAGQGTAVPDPGADPYCVRFDKSNQNVTQLGLIAFLTDEPARFAAAAPKCFYYQEDHWRGSIIQSDQQTVIYEFYGHYFFNKATGDGGVWVTGFTIAGQTFDPRSLPGFPPQYDQYYGPGTGGFITHNDIPTDPNCVAQANSSPASIYAASASHCLRAQGKTTPYRVGPARLGMRPSRVRARFGPPTRTARGVMRYCLAQGGSLFIAKGRRSRSRGPSAAVAIATTGGGFSISSRRRREITVGSSARRLHSAFPAARRIFRIGQVTFFALSPGAEASEHTRPAGGAIVAGTVKHRVAEIAIYDPSRLGHRALARDLAKMR